MKDGKMGLVVALILAAGLVVFGCVVKTPQLLQADAATGGLTMFATLAVGEFDAKAAPLYTKLAIKAHNTAVALKAGKMRVDDAQVVQSQVNSLKTKLKDAEATCKPDKAAGHCTKDGAAADALLAEVSAAIS